MPGEFTPNDDDREAIDQALIRAGELARAYDRALPGSIVLCERGGAWRDRNGRAWGPLSGLLNAIKVGAGWFREYEQIHMRSSQHSASLPMEADAALHKAVRNRERAEYLESVLKDAPREPDFHDGRREALGIAVARLTRWLAAEAGEAFDVVPETDDGSRWYADAKVKYRKRAERILGCTAADDYVLSSEQP